MNKLADIERLKKEYLHRVGTQFDNAIFVAEKQFLIDAYTKDEIVSMFDKIRAEIRKKIAFNSFNEGYVLYDDIVEVLDKYKAESEWKE